jgi:hypothetical protein
MFINTMLISVIQLCLYLMASSIINAVGNKIILSEFSIEPIEADMRLNLEF